MPNLIDCWDKLEKKGYKHGDGSRVLNEHDKASILARISEHVKTGVEPLEAAKLSVQAHLDEAREQLQSVFKQAGVEPGKETKPAAIEEATRFQEGMPLATSIAGRYTNIRGVEPDDVLQHARIALARAAKAFDPTRGSFLPFARTAINNELRGVYRAQGRIPEATSLETPIGETGTTPKDMLAAPTDVRSDVQLAEGRRVINEAVAELPARMQGAITGILDGNTLDSIGQSLGGISRQAVGRLATEAMRRLRGKLGERGVTSTHDLLSQPIDGTEFEVLPHETQDDISHEIFERSSWWKKANEEWRWDATDVKASLEGERLNVRETPISEITGFDRNNAKLAVKKYIEMLGTSEAPPILVDGSKFIDGGHRFEAYRSAGRMTIPTVDIGPLLRMDWNRAYSLSGGQQLDIIDAHISNTLKAQASADPIQQLIDSMDRDHLEELFDKANAEARGKYTIGRPDLALGAEGAAQRAVDQYYTDLWKPKTRETMMKEADAILADKGTGFAKEIAARWLNGDTLRDSEVMAAKTLLSELSRQTGTPEGLQRMMAAGFAYRNIRGQTARDLAAGFDPHKSPEERNREFLAKIISTLPAPKEAEIQAEKDPEKRRSMLDAAMKERLGQLEKAFAYLSKGGLTLDDILNGSWELHGKGSKLIENEMSSFDVPHQQALKLAQTGTRTAKEIAKATGITEVEVERVNDQFVSALRDKLRDKVRAGLTLEKIDMQGALLSQPTEGATALSDEAVNAELNRIIRGMGFVASKDLGKFKVAKAKRRKLFVPPKVPGAVRTANEQAEAPYPEGQAAPYTGRVLGQPGLPLYQEMMVRKGADMSSVDDVVKIARVAQAANGNRFDMLFEAGLANLLSNPITHIAYKLALGGHTGWEFTIQRGMEALVNLLVRDKDSATFGEFKHIWNGVTPALTRGLTLGARQWGTETDLFNQDVMNSQVEMFDNMPGEHRGSSISETPLEQFFGPVAGPVEKRLAKLGRLNPVRGRVIRVPLRVLYWIDGFYHGANAQLGVTPFAYRMARREGLSGEAFSKRLNELVATPGSPAWIKAADLAHWLTARAPILDKEQQREKEPSAMRRFTASQIPFEGIFDNALAQIAKGRNNSHLIGSVLPFIQIPYNLLKMAGGKFLAPIYTPVKMAAAGIAALPRPTYDPNEARFKMKDGKPFFESYPQANFVRHIATAFITSIASAILWNMLAGDEDDDDKWLLVTGSLPVSEVKRGQRELMKRAYGGPYVARIGGRHGVHINFGKVEPAASVLGSIADTLIQVKRLAKGQENIHEAIDAIGGYTDSQIEEKSFLRSLGNLLKTIHGEITWTDFMKRQAVSWLTPGLFRAPMHALDDYIREDRNAPLSQLIMGGGEKKIDLYGKPMEKTGNWFSRMFWLSSQKPYAELQKADRLLLHWNNAHPRDVHAPTPPSTTYTDGTGEGKEKTKQMTPAQSTKFLTDAGHRFEQMLRGQISQHQIDHPKEEDVKMIETLHRDAAEQIKREMFPKGVAPKKTANIIREWKAAA